MNHPYDCVIIGAGISGITAAIYLKRWNFNILLLEKNMPGGSVNKTSVIGNYPGFTKIEGSKFALKLYEQIQELEILYQYADVLEIKKTENYFTVQTTNEKIITKSVILATGRKPRKLGLEKEDQLFGMGISTCAICDGPIYKEKEVCIVGGGNSALEESLYLSKICRTVTIINRSSTLRADQKLQQQVKKQSNIKILYNSKIIELKEENNKLHSIIIQQKDGQQKLSCAGLFIYIGLDPVYPKIENLNTSNGYILVNSKMETNIPNLYACGDIIKKELYQIITAAAEGAIAAHTFKTNFHKD